MYSVCPGGRGKQQFLPHCDPLLPFKNGSEHSLGHQEGSMEETTLALGLEGWLASPQNGAGVVSSGQSCSTLIDASPPTSLLPMCTFQGAWGQS